MKLCLAADLHLTAQKSDEYRWQVFPKLMSVVEKEKADAVVLLGDITDFKDKHPAELVNRMVDGVSALAEKCDVIFVVGNHDYVNAEWPFFQFLKHIPNVHVFSKPVHWCDGTWFLPHTRTPETDWKELLQNPEFCEASLFCMHQPVIGSETSDNYTLDHGLDNLWFSKNISDFDGTVISGDIHHPQVVGDVEYIGSPYPVRFGDDIEGRFVIVDTDKPSEVKSVFLHIIKKAKLRVKSVKDLDDTLTKMKIGPKDQIKIDLELSGDDILSKERLKREVEALLETRGIQSFGCAVSAEKVERASSTQVDEPTTLLGQSKQAVVKFFAQKENLSADIKEIGLLLLEK